MASGERDPQDKGKKLDSWKSIAKYVGRDVRSAQRWERERGLPIHRVPGEKGGSVFAYVAELDAWLHRGTNGDQLDRSEAVSEVVTPIEVQRESVPAANGAAPPAPSGPASREPLVETEPASRPTAEAAAGIRPRTGRLRLIWIGLAAIALVALVAAAYFKSRRAPSPSTPSKGRVMLAVLPFANLSGDPSQDYFADGLTEEMITDLGRLNPQVLGVIARTSAMNYKQTHKDIRQIGAELGVNYVLEGSVRRQGDTARISAQLIQVSDQTHVWAQNYERQVKDILSVQQDVAEAIAGRIRISLERQPSLTSAPAANPEAYDDYLKGLYFWNRRDEPGLEQSIKYFRQAVQEDPNYVPAYAALAQSYTLEGVGNARLRGQALPGAEAAARRAIVLDDSSAEGHTALAGIRVFYYYDWAGAEAEFRRAIELNPNYASAHHWYANLYLDPVGRFADAIAEMKLALELDPTNLIVNADLGQAYYFARQYQAAVDTCRKTIEMDPSFLPSHWYLADAYHQLGMTPQEVAETAHFISQEHAARPEVGAGGDWGKVLTDAYSTRGYQAFLEAMLKEFQAFKRPGLAPPERLATTYFLLGQRDQAMTALEQSYQQHAPNIIYLKADPYYDPLRSDPRFQALERSMGLLP